MQVQVPSELQLNALNLQPLSLVDKSFAVFFGRHDYNVVKNSKIVPFEVGLLKCKAARNSALERAVQEAIGHIKALVANPHQTAAQIWC